MEPRPEAPSIPADGTVAANTPLVPLLASGRFWCVFLRHRYVDRRKPAQEVDWSPWTSTFWNGTALPSGVIGSS